MLARRLHLALTEFARSITGAKHGEQSRNRTWSVVIMYIYTRLMRGPLSPGRRVGTSSRRRSSTTPSSPLSPSSPSSGRRSPPRSTAGGGPARSDCPRLASWWSAPASSQAYRSGRLEGVVWGTHLGTRRPRPRRRRSRSFGFPSLASALPDERLAPPAGCRSTSPRPQRSPWHSWPRCPGFESFAASLAVAACPCPDRPPPLTSPCRRTPTSIPPACLKQQRLLR